MDWPFEGQLTIFQVFLMSLPQESFPPGGVKGARSPPLRLHGVESWLCEQDSRARKTELIPALKGLLSNMKWPVSCIINNPSEREKSEALG